MNKLRDKVRRIVRVIQKGLVITLLFILYVFGFGATFILSCLFNSLRPGPKSRNKDSFWTGAAGYDESEDELTRQS